MSLTLYYGSGSPYAWRARLALAHKALDHEVRTLSFAAGDLRTPEYLAINPRGRVPALVDDGFALWESTAIVEYLDQRYPERPLFPRDPRDAATVRRMVQEVDCYFVPPMEWLVDELLTAGHAPSETRVAEARAALLAEAGRWESVVRARSFLAGDNPTAADYALYPALALVLRLESRHAPVAVKEGLGPAFLKWKARMEALAIVRDTWPPHWGTWRP
jgi:glutathione S-transferase